MNKGQAAVAVGAGVGLSALAYYLWKRGKAQEELVYCPNQSRYVPKSQYDPAICGMVPVRTLPGAPTGLAAFVTMAIGSGPRYELSWIPPTDKGTYTAVTYYVYVYDKSGALITKTYVGSDLAYRAPASPGDELTFNVSALNPIGEGPKSTPFALVIPVQPSPTSPSVSTTTAEATPVREWVPSDVVIVVPPTGGQQ